MSHHRCVQLLVFILVLLSASVSAAQVIPTDEATVPTLVASPEFLLPGDPEALKKGTFYNPMTLRAGGEVLLFLYWWGYFAWGVAEPDAFPDQVGSIRVYPDDPTPGQYRVQIRSGGIFHDVLADGSFDFVPDSIAFDSAASEIFVAPDGRPAVAQGELREKADAVGGCAGDDFPTLASGLRVRDLSETSFGPTVRLSSRVRAMPSANITGFQSAEVLLDNSQNHVAIVASTERICQTFASWPPGGNTFQGLEIASSTLVDPSTIVRDSFGLFSPARDLGDPLSGTATEVGGISWTTVGNPVLGENQVTGATATALVGRLDVQGELTEDIITVSALVSQSTSWGGIGFFANPTAGLRASGSVAVVIYPDSDRVQVWGDGSDTVITELTGFQLTPGVPSQLAISLDIVGNRVSATVDGQSVLEDFALDSLAVQANPNIVGFHLNGATMGVSTVDFVEVDQFSARIFSDGFESGDLTAWSSSSP